MKVFKKLFKIIFFVIYPHFLFSQNFTKSDLNFLNFNDKKIFLERCLIKKNFKDTPQCLNFLGLKILLYNLDNSEISKESLKYIENQSIFYLEEAAKRGFIDAYINLAWIYSNDNFGLQDLTKSAEYFKIYHNLKKKDLHISKLQTEKEDQINYDRDQIILGILLMQKIDIYKKYNLDKENYYLTEIEYKNGKKVFNQILKISNLSELDIDNLKKVVLKNNNADFNELASNLSTFEKKYRRTAIKELNKLKEILQKLN